MATGVVLRWLEKSDPAQLFSELAADPQDTLDAEMMVSHLMASRQKQKLMCLQLCMLDSMMEFLCELKSPLDFLNDQCPRASEGDSRKQWKALKRQYQAGLVEGDARKQWTALKRQYQAGLAEKEGDSRKQWKALKRQYQAGLVEVEDMTCRLQEQSVQLQQRRDKLNTLVLLLEQKKEECQAVERIRMRKNKTAEMQTSLGLDDSLQKAQHALQQCERQLGSLQQESHGLQSHLDHLSAIRDGLLSSLQVCQSQVQYQVSAWVSATDMSVELRPHSQQLEPLKLTVTPKPPHHFHLQVFQGNAGVQEETLRGSAEELGATMLLVMQNYLAQGGMLHEMQTLHSRFAIDWRPAQRLLVFLKTASVVCHLVVEEGYPTQGSATLQAVRKEGHELNIASLQPPSPQPSLTEWLEFLSCCPDL
ncbi:uncharacterized protein si:dkey-225f5.4 [Engraulis encrasicolus]|uniref:uncharacterized protein si:dkey-225f5.4 n=1 Tax=Engraulis encrasicolus TaxID=184585 RepID=UPI002FD0A089